ncbi:MAG: hypothetical protein ACLQIB_40905 [Isosphaeraceae bacterium]
MKRLLGIAFLAILAAGSGNSIQADDEIAKATLDKAIKALGGEEKLAKVEAFTWKSKGKFIINGSENKFSSQVTVQGLDQYRSEFDGEFNGNTAQHVTVLKGDKGWRKDGDQVIEMNKDQVANAKRSIYLMVVPTTLVALKGTNFEIGTAGEEKVGEKQAVVIKAKGPDGKDFTIYFDKESGVPVKLAAKMTGFMGEEFTMETSFANYKDCDGIQKATKIESNRDGEKFLDAELTEFKIVDKVDASTFDQPK